MAIKQSDVETLVELFQTSGWQDLHLKCGADELFLSKNADAALPGSAARPVGQESQPAAPAAAAAAARPAPAPEAAAAPAASTDRDGWVEIKAANLGTFYRAPNPEADPYVREGDTVDEQTEICLIEVMKLFTTIRAGVAGTVREIVAQDGEMVEYGATLMWIEPAD